MTSQGGDITILFDSIQASFPSSVSPHGWYIVTASALIACNPALIGQLYTYVTRELENHEPPTARRVINRRFREILIKQTVTLGGPRIVIAFRSLQQAEEPGDADPTFTRSNITLDAANRERGTNFMVRVFGEEQAAKQYDNIGADIDWLFRDVYYGLLLSNEAVLNLVETQMMTCTALWCEGNPLLRPLQVLHVGGLRNLDLRLDEAEGVFSAVESVARWVGKDTRSWLLVRQLVPDWKAESQTSPNSSVVNEERNR